MGIASSVQLRAAILFGLIIDIFICAYLCSSVVQIQPYAARKRRKK